MDRGEGDLAEDDDEVEDDEEGLEVWWGNGRGENRRRGVGGRWLKGGRERAATAAARWVDDEIGDEKKKTFFNAR